MSVRIRNQALQMVREGYTIGEICKELNLSVKTLYKWRRRAGLVKETVWRGNGKLTYKQLEEFKKVFFREKMTIVEARKYLKETYNVVYDNPSHWSRFTKREGLR